MEAGKAGAWKNHLLKFVRDEQNRKYYLPKENFNLF